MNVHLTAELEELVQTKVRSGRYNSASEVVREALRLMEERDQLRAMHKEEIRRKIDQGLESLRRGRGVDGELVFDRIDAELQAMEGSSRE
jgi:putative addiction module antidote protein, CC2985 family